MLAYHLLLFIVLLPAAWTQGKKKVVHALWLTQIVSLFMLCLHGAAYTFSNYYSTRFQMIA